MDVITVQKSLYKHTRRSF